MTVELLSEVAGLNPVLDADDIMQETSMALWQKFADYDADRSFLPWALRFAYFQTKRQQERNREDQQIGPGMTKALHEHPGPRLFHRLLPEQGRLDLDQLVPDAQALQQVENTSNGRGANQAPDPR